MHFTNHTALITLWGIVINKRFWILKLFLILKRSLLKAEPVPFENAIFPSISLSLSFKAVNTFIILNFFGIVLQVIIAF